MSYSSLNRVVLIGRLTQDPELRELPSGQSVCNLRVACNGNRRDPEGGYSERPNYFDVATFGAQADNVSRYTCKGSRIAIDGRLAWREWETADQQKRQAVRVVAESVQFLDGPAVEDRDGEPGDGEDSGGEEELVAVGEQEREIVDLAF
jgi:single-strand DNA-binding protein